MRKIILILTVFAWIISGRTQTYNPDSAAAYARKYCSTPNPDYPYYNLDCANFVSQCLKAGGLDLSVGIDPDKRPPQNGVNGRYGCIDNATNLMYHLEHYQNTTNRLVVNFNPPDNHDLGDPMFWVNSSGNDASHSLICSSLDANATQLYSYHSSDVCDEDFTFLYANIKFFHIIVPPPAHCENCIQDGDETGIDCGGSCPPCQHAPNNRMYNTNTTSLPAETYAINNITAGNASVQVLPGQNVAFYSAGSIDLLDGFHAHAGSNFMAQPKKKRFDATADCQAFCDPEIANVVTKNGDGINDVWMGSFANAKTIRFHLIQWNTNRHPNNFDMTKEIYLQQDGEVELWNTEEGSPDYGSKCDFGDKFIFVYQLSVESCQGEWVTYPTDFLTVYYVNNQRSKPSTPTDTNISSLDAYSPTDILISQNGDMLSIESNTIGNEEMVGVEIYNTLGQLVYQTKCSLNQPITFPTHLKGIFLMKIRATSGMYQKKFVMM